MLRASDDGRKLEQERAKRVRAEHRAAIFRRALAEAVAERRYALRQAGRLHAEALATRD